jgi:predicted GIY-YIG superfamily endonuclease
MYMLRCRNDAYYTGSTSYDDVETRVAEHNDGRFAGYTRRFRPVTLVFAEWFIDLRQAQDFERQVKGWNREKKEALIRREWAALPELSKRPGARRPSRPAARAPQDDALGEADPNQ